MRPSSMRPAVPSQSPVGDHRRHAAIHWADRRRDFRLAPASTARSSTHRRYPPPAWRVRRSTTGWSRRWRGTAMSGRRRRHRRGGMPESRVVPPSGAGPDVRCPAIGLGPMCRRTGPISGRRRDSRGSTATMASVMSSGSPNASGPSCASRAFRTRSWTFWLTNRMICCSNEASSVIVASVPSCRQYSQASGVKRVNHISSSTSTSSYLP